MGETGFDSTPKTRGVLVRARKPSETARMKKGPVTIGSALPEEGSDKAGLPRPSTVEELAARALALGAESAKIIDTDSVVVEKWVKWKCMYGCPMYNNDGYHPPRTPDLDEVKGVLGEYAKAILLSGKDGRFLSEVACRLEGEAYYAGFYKAFAMVALPPGAEAEATPGET